MLSGAYVLGWLVFSVVITSQTGCRYSPHASQETEKTGLGRGGVSIDCSTFKSLNSELYLQNYICPQIFDSFHSKCGKLILCEPERKTLELAHISSTEDNVNIFRCANTIKTISKPCCDLAFREVWVGNNLPINMKYLPWMLSNCLYFSYGWERLV